MFKSLTAAQTAIMILKSAGIVGELTKPPLRMGAGSCSYAVRVSEYSFNKGRKALRDRGAQVIKAYCMSSMGKYEEVVF